MRRRGDGTKTTAKGECPMFSNGVVDCPPTTDGICVFRYLIPIALYTYTLLLILLRSNIFVVLWILVLLLLVVLLS